MNVMMKGIIINKIQTVIVPEIMRKFQDIDIPEISKSESAYEAKIYNCHATLVPFNPDQLHITMNPDRNTVEI